MGLIAKTYRDDAERGAALAIVLSGLALGVVSKLEYQLQLIIVNSPSALMFTQNVVHVCF